MARTITWLDGQTILPESNAPGAIEWDWRDGHAGSLPSLVEGAASTSALIDATDAPDTAELLMLFPALALISATEPTDVAELIAAVSIGTLFNATELPDTAELAAAVRVQGLLNTTDAVDVAAFLLGASAQLREVQITHRTIPVPPARVGQTEWAEQHLILDGSLNILAVAGLEARLPLRGAGSPEGAVVANRGRMYLRTDGGTGSTLYVKEADDGLATGWAAK